MIKDIDLSQVLRGGLGRQHHVRGAGEEQRGAAHQGRHPPQAGGAAHLPRLRHAHLHEDLPHHLPLLLHAHGAAVPAH